MKTFALQVGDVISLRSGGSAMTLEAIDGDAAVCVWMDRAGKFRREQLPIDCVRKGTAEFDNLPHLVICDGSCNRGLLESKLGVSGNA